MALGETANRVRGGAAGRGRAGAHRADLPRLERSVAAVPPAGGGARGAGRGGRGGGVVQRRHRDQPRPARPPPHDGQDARQKCELMINSH